VASIVLLNVISPSKLSAELELFGHLVWEALDISEVLFLCDQHKVDVVIVAAEVERGVDREAAGGSGDAARQECRCRVCRLGSVAVISEE